MTELDRGAALDCFYELIARLEVAAGGRRRLADCSGAMSWPRLGVYFLFEDGEVRGDGVTPRVARIGTHALRPSKSTLWGRLAQHRGTSGGSMPGGGNHRGSIFRLHVGTALLNSSELPAEIRTTWSVGSTASADVRRGEYPLEQAVSTRIGAMHCLWLSVDDPPGASSDRGRIEAGAIALLSNLDRAQIDPPSSTWLGRFADREVIRRSGLWNVNHVADPPTDEFLAVLRAWIERAET